MFDLKGKVALVTGGNGGIGLGMARGLAKAGACIFVAARNEEKSAAAVQDLQSLGAEAFAVQVDVSDEKSVGEMVTTIVRQCSSIDILINNAGMNIRKQPQDLPLAQWRQIMDTNLTSAFLCARDVYPHMKRSGSGKIINIGSMLSIFGVSHLPAYGSSKGGLVQLTKSLAVAWAMDNIQVNAVLPGWIDTDLTRTANEKDPTLYERILGRTPAGRWGSIDDLAGVAVFLACRASDFITGTTVVVDGGYSALC